MKRRRASGRGAAAGALGALAALALAELGLRAAGFEFRPVPMIVIAGQVWSGTGTDWLQPDPVLFWRLRGADPAAFVVRWERPAPEAASAAPDARSDPAAPPPPAAAAPPESAPNRAVAPSASARRPLLSAVVPTMELAPVPARPAAGARRVICLGDSCTFFGQPSYPQRLEEKLAQAAGAGAWEVVNAGVPGYSIIQGLAAFTGPLAGLEGQVLTVFFGWNDHWRAACFPDARAARFLAGPDAPWWRRLRLRQAAGKLACSLAGGRFAPRVPLADYEAALDRLVGLARDRGLAPVLVTAPCGFDPDRPPAHLAEQGYFEPLSELAATHRAYTEATRAAAARSGARLADLADGLENRPDRAAFFLRDGIHFSAAGVEFAAEALAGEALAAEVMAP